ncbi:MAG: nucleotide exchange factor GrpE [Ruminococcus sp.]|nr:nucleotide exchange factor GrpE [Ruminococcus sp.]MCM1382816.1 nucleotide exchange factor GrpE [Muribaculaceae bacterium]MCM1479368.1 nucleotide exchange factor GrpE [Muribaculaceae bacterium]
MNEKEIEKETEVPEEETETEEIPEEITEDETAEETAEEVHEENLEEKVKALEEAAAADRDKYLRLLAEYDNFRKRSVQEKLNAFSDATAKAALEVISVIDNFERAMAADCSDENYKKGVEMIYGQFTEVIKKLGVEEIDALGKDFDPNLHNAVSQIEDENLGENVVSQVYQKGYKLGDKVIRCAMVVVANP